MKISVARSLSFNPRSREARTRYAAARSRDGKRRHVPYVYRRPIEVAVSAALVTGRPLLLRGSPGSGKSTLAYDIAVASGWRYYERVVASRMSAQDLLWQFDAVKRLSDAQAKSAKEPKAYVRPQPMWWALDPKSAAKLAPGADPGSGGRADRGAVILIDEIDKADPDVPNDLLVVLGDGRFRVPELEFEVERTREQVMVVITTNGERELPAAFLRRCVCLTLATPDRDTLREIALAHQPRWQDDTTLDALLTRMQAIAASCKVEQHRPGTAEILDALDACAKLKIGADHPDWKTLTLAMGWKNPGEPPTGLP